MNARLAAVVTALVAAAPAAAAFTPRLVVNASGQQTGARAALTIRYAQPGAPDATARVVVYVPEGYALPEAQPAGTQVGTVAATMTARSLGGNVLPLAGDVVVRGESGTYLANGTQVPLQPAAAACTGSASHTAFWVLTLTATGLTFEVPVYVDAAPAGAPFAAYSLTLCLPPPDLPPPDGAPFGARLLTLAMGLGTVVNPPRPGAYRWRAVATPYVPGTATADAAAAAEVQSLAPLPSRVTLTATASKGRRTALVSYRAGVVSNGRAVASQLLVLRGGSPRGVGTLVARASVTATLRGSFRVALTRRRRTLYLLARAVVPDRDLEGAACVASFGLPCVSATGGGFALVSAVAKVSLQARR